MITDRSSLIRRLDWPLLGSLPPARAVLLVSGLLVAGASIFVRLPTATAEEPAT
jgi:hypothetical protein